MDARNSIRSWLGALGGLLWIGAWTVALILVHSPWENLGGLVGERLRWLERVVLLTGVLVGVTAGAIARAISRVRSSVCYARRLRWLLYPPAVATAAGLMALRVQGNVDPIGVVFAGFLAYWAGLDLTFGAIPLMERRFLDRDQDGDGSPD